MTQGGGCDVAWPFRVLSLAFSNVGRSTEENVNIFEISFGHKTNWTKRVCCKLIIIIHNILV